MTSGKYEVVVVSKSEDLKTFNQSIPYIISNLNPAEIIVICSKSDSKLISTEYQNVRVLDEDSIIPGLSISAVKEFLKKLTGDDKRAGWYFQQFLKMAYSYISIDENYLIVDADTIFLSPIEFIDSVQRYLFSIKTEYHIPYFETIQNLLGYGKIAEGSFIAEHMIISKLFMQELIQSISRVKRNQNGSDGCDTYGFWKIILQNINPKDISGSGFSEFETYGTFVMHNHPESCQFRKLKSCRHARCVLGDSPSKEMIDWAAEYYDIISFEKWSKPCPIISTLSHNSSLRKVFPLKCLEKTAFIISSLLDKVHLI